MNSDTPRTDAAAKKGAYMSDGDYSSTQGKQFVHVDFARQLERELNDANRQAALYNADTMKVMDQRDQWKAMAQEVISKFKHNHVNNGIDDACKQCGFDLRHEIHIRFNSINKCHHGIRDTATNLPYCRKCDEEGLK